MEWMPDKLERRHATPCQAAKVRSEKSLPHLCGRVGEARAVLGPVAFGAAFEACPGAVAAALHVVSPLTCLRKHPVPAMAFNGQPFSEST